MVALLAGCSSLGLGEEVSDEDPASPEATVNDETLASAEVEPVEEPPDPAEIADIWERADDGVLAPDNAGSSFYDIMAPVTDGDPWLIVGSLDDPETSSGTAAVWEVTTPASGRWKRIDVAPQTPDTAEYMRTVVQAGDLTVVGGSTGRGPQVRAALWVREPSGEWERIDSPAFDSDWPENLWTLKWNEPTSLLVAQGTRTADDGVPQTVFWTSEDGRTWARIDSDALDQGELNRPTSLAVGDDGIVAAGSAEVGDAPVAGRIWLSDNGSTWRSVEPESMAGPEPIYVNDLAIVDGQYVAVGSVRHDGKFKPASWVSVDGETWDGPFESWQANDDGRTTTIGFGAGSVVSAGDRLLATATRPFMQHVWSSTDGRNWQPVADLWEIRDAGVVIRDVDSDGTLTAAVTDEPSVLFHDTIWNESPLDDDVVPRPTETPYINDVTATAEGFVAVGATQARPTRLRYEFEGEVWVSDDGHTWDSDAAFPRNEMGPMGSVSSIDGEPFISMTQSIESAVRRSVPGVGLLLRRNSTAWGSVFEFSSAEHRSAVSNSVLSGDELVVGGWQFADDRTRTEARLGAVPLAEVVRPGTTPLTMAEPPVWDGDATGIHHMCVDDAGTVTAIGSGETEDDRSNFMVARRPVSGEWENTTAADESFTGAESQLANACAHGVDGTLLVGWVYNGGNQDGAIWSQQSDGQWARVDVAELVGDGDQAIVEIVAVGDRYVVLGYDGQSGASQATVWLGSGKEWQEIPFGPEPWSMQSLQMATNWQQDSTVSAEEAQLIVTGWQYGRAVVYQTTFGQLVDAAQQLSDLAEDAEESQEADE